MLNLSEKKDWFDPNHYIKTASGSLLAFIKLLEAIGAGIGICALLFVSKGIDWLSREIVNYINQYINFMLPNAAARFMSGILRFPMLIPALCLLLIFLDGIGVFMMRHSDTGEGLVSLVHFIYWIGHVIQIIGLIVGVYRYISGMNQINRSLRGTEATASGAAFINLLGVFVYPIFVLAFIFLLFMCNYHHDIYVVLKTVREERRTRRITKPGRNHLIGRAGWLISGALALLIINGFLLVVLSSGVDFVPNEILQNIPQLTPIALTVIITAFCLLNFLKYFALRKCAVKFKKVHQM